MVRRREPWMANVVNRVFVLAGRWGKVAIWLYFDGREMRVLAQSAVNLSSRCYILRKRDPSREGSLLRAEKLSF